MSSRAQAWPQCMGEICRRKLGASTGGMDMCVDFIRTVDEVKKYSNKMWGEVWVWEDVIASVGWEFNCYSSEFLQRLDISYGCKWKITQQQSRCNTCLTLSVIPCFHANFAYFPFPKDGGECSFLVWSYQLWCRGCCLLSSGLWNISGYRVFPAR